MMQVAGVGIQSFNLPADGFCYPWVAMADVWHIVVHIKVLIAVRIIQPNTFSPNNVHRLLVEKTIGFTHQALTAL
jgi:hypothetical protein